MRKQVAVLAVVLSLCVSVAAQTPQELEAWLERDLAASDPQALVLWKKAHAAREAERHDEAIALYAQVVRRVPWFDHALRMQAIEEMRAGRGADAVTHARAALALQRSADNLSSLAWVLMISEGNLDEAMTLAREAANAKPDDPSVVQVLALAGQRTQDLDTLRAATLRLENIDPENPKTHLFRAALATRSGDFKGAQAALDRAKSFGLPQDEYEYARDWVESARPVHLRWWKGALLALAAWFAGFGLMLVTGAILSRMALRAARTTNGLSAKVRRLYAIVLGASCAFYYASLPIVIAFVLAFTAGLLYVTSRLGRVPIKLAALLVVVAIVSVVSMLKSLFFRPKEGEPGLRLDLAREPKLQAMLDAVAAKIGTRAVDNVYMTPSTEVAVMERGNERRLILGVAALDGLRVRPLKSILGHEYGHFTNRDTAGGAFALAVRRSLAFTAAGMEAGGADTWYNPAWWFVNAFHSLFLRISQGASRLQEMLADRWAAFAYGADAFEEGLRHVVTRAVLFDMHFSTTLKEVVNERLPLANLYTYQPRGKQRDVSSLVESALSATSSVYDSHPAPAERFALIRNLPQQDVAAAEDDDAPASSLFSNFEALQMRMTAAVRENVRARTGMEIPAAPPLQSGA